MKQSYLAEIKDGLSHPTKQAVKPAPSVISNRNGKEDIPRHDGSVRKVSQWNINVIHDSIF